MNSTGIALLSTAALLAAGSATAGEMGGGSDISWNYAQLGYVQVDGNDFFDSDGFDFTGSLALSSNWHAGLSFTSLSGDSEYYSGNDLDSDTWLFSIGYNTGISKNAQAYADIGYFDTDVDADNLDGGEGDSTGLNLTAGIRAQLSPKFEVGAALTYVNGSTDFDSGDIDFKDTSYSLYGQYFFTPQFSAGALAKFGGSSSIGDSFFSSSGDQLNLFVRYSFGGMGSDSMGASY